MKGNVENFPATRVMNLNAMGYTKREFNKHNFYTSITYLCMNICRYIRAKI